MAVKVDLHYVTSGADMLPVLGMIEELHAAEWGDFPLNRNKVAATLIECVAGGAVIMAVVDGESAGLLALAPDSLWFSDEPALVDRVFYVRPGRRPWDAIAIWRALLDEAMALQEAGGIPVYFVNSSRNKTNRKDRLYSRYLEPAGRIFHRPR